jgi:hypothetical protein
LNAAMSNDKTFRTNYPYIKANEKHLDSTPVVYIFLSLGREPSGEECEELAQKYFEVHNKMTLLGKPLTVDLRPAFREALANVTPKFSTSGQH